MKVHALFPTACRAEQAVHAPPEDLRGPATSATVPATVAATVPSSAPAAFSRERSVSGVPLRRGRAFPTTRPHPGGSASHHGIGP